MIANPGSEAGSPVTMWLCFIHKSREMHKASSKSRRLCLKKERTYIDRPQGKLIHLIDGFLPKTDIPFDIF